MEALNELAEAIRERLEAGNLSAKDLRDIAVALGITVQRSREERGEDKEVPQQRSQVIMYLPDDGRLSPEKRAELLGQPLYPASEPRPQPQTTICVPYSPRLNGPLPGYEHPHEEMQRRQAIRQTPALLPPAAADDARDGRT